MSTQKDLVAAGKGDTPVCRKRSNKSCQRAGIFGENKYENDITHICQGFCHLLTGLHLHWL
jgi:hypothetical protein